MHDIERRIRAANPHPSGRSEPMSERAEQELAVLLQTPRRPAAPAERLRGASPLFVSGVAAALVILAVIAASTLLAPRSAMASPPLLDFAPLTGTSDILLERLAMNARDAAFAQTSTTIAAETWSADLTETDGHLAYFVQPREVVRTRTAELSGSIVVRAGEIKWGSVASGEQAVTPGAELERSDYPAGSYPLLFADAPPSDPVKLVSYLASYVGTTSTSSTGEYFRAISDLRNEWALDGAQTAAVLEFIGTLPGVTVAGSVTDRLGRAGVAVTTQTRSSGVFRDLLIFDQATGVLLSAEQVYLGGDPNINLEHNTVLNYIAWKEHIP